MNAPAALTCITAYAAIMAEIDKNPVATAHLRLREQHSTHTEQADPVRMMLSMNAVNAATLPLRCRLPTSGKSTTSGPMPAPLRSLGSIKSISNIWWTPLSGSSSAPWTLSLRNLMYVGGIL
jgi:hypothetical protein